MSLDTIVNVETTGTMVVDIEQPKADVSVNQSASLIIFAGERGPAGLPSPDSFDIDLPTLYATAKL